MTSIYFLNLSQKHTGLTNQLNSIMSTICKCLYKEQIIVIDKFLKEIHTDNYLPISDVINLEKTNKFLEKYNIAIVDGCFTNNLNIISAKYCCDGIFTDVTEKVKVFLNNNTFIMSNNVNINNLFENCNNSKKILKIDFILNNYNKFSLSFSEKNGFLTKNIEIDFSNKNYIMAPSWDFIDSLEFKHTTNDIYNNIIFSDIFIYQSNNFINKINITNNCNVNIIHLRLEQDAIDFWSEPNKMTRDNFKIKLSEKYINLITKLINKNDKSIILTYNTDNIVINYLKNNNYNYNLFIKSICR